MSYKDGIPLLSTFEDEPEEDGYGINSEVEKRKCKCVKGHICFGIVLLFAGVLVIAVAISVTLGFVLKNKSGGNHPAASGHDTGYSTVAGLGLSSVSYDVSNGVTNTSASSVFQLEPSAVSGQVSGTGAAPVVPTTSPGPSVVLVSGSGAPATMPSSTWPAVAASSEVGQPSLVASAVISTSSVILPSQTPVSSSTPSLSSAAAPIVSPSSAKLPTSYAGSQAPPIVSTNDLPLPSSTALSSAASIIATPTASPTAPPMTAPPPTPNCKDDVMCPSPQDGRSYHFTQLPGNSLRVVLISDPSTDLSGAAMNVNAGSFNDPANYTGLAHFCEHMLFLGTGKYPDKNEYSMYLSTHGGGDNAYTSNQETNYFFTIQAGFLNHSLDMFAHFFIDPLFDAVYVQKELNAVNQEHQKNLLNDEWKVWQLLKYVSSRDHPFHQFSTGDFETLNKSDVREQLLQYYNSRYSASTMNLVVYGKENISTLLDMVTSYFSDIPNNNAHPVTYGSIQPFTSLAGRIIVYQPQASTNTLTLYWQTPSLQEHPRQAVSDFIVRYLGHEGEGSIFKYLQRRSLATAVTASVEVAADSFYLFKLQITLTEEGLTSASQVIGTAFEFMNNFKNNFKNISEDVLMKWYDFVGVSQVAFDYKEKVSPSDYVQDISSAMRVNDNPADFLPNPRRYSPDNDLIKSTLRHFTPANCLIFIGTQKVNVSSNPSSQDSFETVRQDILTSDTGTVPLPTLDLVEPIYSTPFIIYKIPPVLHSYWSADNSNSELHLATPNMFIPDVAHLTPVPPSNETAPTSISSNPTVQTWVFPDTRSFNEPKVNLRCELRSGKPLKTPQWAAMAQVYLDMVNSKLGSTVYSAEEVGYTLSLVPNPRGVEFELGGLSDNDIIRNLINVTINALMNDGDMLNDSVAFNLAVGDFSDFLRNFNFTNLPFRYTYHYIQDVLLERPTWTHERILQQLDGLDLAAVLQFGSSSLVKDLNIVCLVHGSTTTSTAENYVSLLSTILSTRISSSLITTSGYPTSRAQLVIGKEYGLSLPTLNPMDSNSVVNVLFQAGEVCQSSSGSSCSPDSLLTGVHLSLLNLIIGDECFTQLRTIEGLGYVAFCSSNVRENFGSFQVLVQSEEFSPGHVLNSINSFLRNYFNQTVLSADFAHSFSDKVDVLRLTLSQKDLSLSDKTDRVWPEIMSGELRFDLRQQQLSIMDGLFVESFQDFYHELILEEEMWRKLTVVVYGRGKEFNLDVNCDILYDQIDQTGTGLKSSCS